MTRKDYIKRNVKLCIAAICGFSFFLFVTNPQSLPVVLLLVIPLLLGLTSLFAVRSLGAVFTRVSIDRLKRFSVLVAGGVLLIALLGSLGQLDFQDVLLSSLLVGGLGFYTNRFNQQEN